jgi:hypothetical protein
VIGGAAICPPAPLLARELTGLDPVLPELREACTAAVKRLVRSGPELIAVVGAGCRSATWPADGRLDLAAFAPALGGSGPGSAPPLPMTLGLGTRLLDEGGYRGPRRLQSVGQDEPAAACVRLGAELSRLGNRVGLLVMADGSACRSLRAPGYLDPRAAAFDAALEQAVRGGDLEALRPMDENVARELLASGRPAWQVLAGAMPGRPATADILYTGDPFGVFYLVAWLAGPAGSAPHAHANADESLPLQVPGQAPWTAGSGNRPAGAVPYTSGSPAMSSSGCTAPPDLLRYSPAARQPRSRCTRLPWTRNTWPVSQAEASEAR